MGREFESHPDHNRRKVLRFMERKTFLFYSDAQLLKLSAIFASIYWYFRKKVEFMRKEETQELAVTAIFTAILLLQTFVPLIGYIHILPGLPAITTVPLTIAVYASLMGPKAGAFFGLFWGITRLIMAYAAPSDLITIMLFQNPFIALIPRMAAGFLPGIISKKKSGMISFFIAGLSASLANTLLVILLTDLFYLQNSTKLISTLGMTNNQPLIIMLLIALGTNGIIEMIFTGVLTPIVLKPLTKLMQKM